MTKVSGNLRALCWDMYILTYVHSAPVEGNFTDTSGHAVKPWQQKTAVHTRGFVDRSDGMVSGYRIAWKTWK